MRDKRLIQISGKTLGLLAMPDFCARCFWVRFRVRLPYQIFPGIFSSIDAYSKRVLEHWFSDHRSPPPWLSCLGPVVGLVPCPHWSRFQLRDADTGVVLTGVPDALFTREDGGLIVGDLKTARYSEAQDELQPMYHVQLNSYALIAQNRGETVHGLVLIYTEPMTGREDCVGRCCEHGFDMGFLGRVVTVPLRTGCIAPLLVETRRICDSNAAPARNPQCKDCGLTEELVSLLRSSREPDLTGVSAVSATAARTRKRT